MRNVPWFHMVAGDVISMPDKWEYPWFAAWDLAFHSAPLSLVDVDFAKEQVELLLKTRYQHPNGQIPAYEWNFSDVNPPVTAWAALFVYEREAEIRGEGDREFLARVFNRLLANFTWWVNRKDPDDRNLFQGGFLGLDNIGIFDRSAPLPGGGTLEQADGTAWMALYCQWMLQIAAELAREDPAYVDMALKFVAHFVWIAIAIDPPGADTALWDEEDGFYYDVMRMPDGDRIRLKVRSLVGLLPMCAATVFDGDLMARHPELAERAAEFVAHFADAVPELLHLPGPSPDGRRLLVARRRGAAAADPRRSCSTSRSSSARTGSAPSRAGTSTTRACSTGTARSTRVRYLPAESDTGMFGGNSNWRGPVWFPMNLVIIRALLQLHRYYGDRLKVECPTGSGRELNLDEVATEISRRLAATFTEDEHGRRPVFGGIEKFQTDPHWHDLLLFHEYFHGDNGAGHRRQPPDRLDRHGRRAAAPAGGGRVHPAPAAARRRLTRPPCACRPPHRLRDQHGGVAAAAGPRRRPAAAPRRGAAQTWDDLAALPGRRRLADGRLAAQPGRAARSRARTRRSTAGNRAALPDLRDEDVIGSPYCVRDYVVDERFGGPRRAGRAPAPQLAARGLGLILDYVPNHVAPDHPWVTERPGLLPARRRGRARPAAGGVPAHRRRHLRPRPRPVLPAVARRRAAQRLRARRCATRSPRCSPASPGSATGCAATWRC